MDHGRTTGRRKISPAPDDQPGGEAATVRRQGARAKRAPNAAADATFTLTLLIRHPDIDPEKISKALRLEPFRSWKQGDARSTPKGTPLPGHWADSRWNHVVHYEATKSVANAVSEWLTHLQTSRSFLATIRKSGGTISLSASLPGRMHRGESIASQTLKALSELGVDFGFEVFPEWSGAPSPGYARSN